VCFEKPVLEGNINLPKSSFHDTSFVIERRLVLEGTICFEKLIMIFFFQKDRFEMHCRKHVLEVLFQKFWSGKKSCSGSGNS